MPDWITSRKSVILRKFHEWWLRPAELGFAPSGNRDVVCVFFGVVCYVFADHDRFPRGGDMGSPPPPERAPRAAFKLNFSNRLNSRRPRHSVVRRLRRA